MKTKSPYQFNALRSATFKNNILFNPCKLPFMTLLYTFLRLSVSLHIVSVKQNNVPIM